MTSVLTARSIANGGSTIIISMLLVAVPRSCPPPPNVTRLCAAVAPQKSCEQRVASASAEVEALRLAVAEANAHAQDASERLVQEVAKAMKRAGCAQPKLEFALR